MMPWDFDVASFKACAGAPAHIRRSAAGEIATAIIGNRVVERFASLGAGEGRVERELLAYFPNAHLTAIDHSACAINMLGASFTAKHFRGIVTDLSLPVAEFDRSHFDCVLALFILHHLRDWRCALQRTVRTLRRPGGILVLARQVGDFALLDGDAVATSSIADLFATFCDALCRQRAKRGAPWQRSPSATRVDPIIDALGSDAEIVATLRSETWTVQDYSIGWWIRRMHPASATVFAPITSGLTMCERYEMYHHLARDLCPNASAYDAPVQYTCANEFLVVRLH